LREIPRNQIAGAASVVELVAVEIELFRIELEGEGETLNCDGRPDAHSEAIFCDIQCETFAQS